jgi:hypothetical protein
MFSRMVKVQIHFGIAPYNKISQADATINSVLVPTFSLHPSSSFVIEPPPHFNKFQREITMGTIPASTCRGKELIY